MSRFRGSAGTAGLAGLACIVLAACGSSAGLSTSGSDHATTNAAAMSAGGTSTAMGSMKMGSQEAAADKVDGIKAIPTQMLGSSDWQGMKISAMAMTAVPFVIFNGTSERTVKPPKDVSFHLMVRLDDSHTNYPIPYANVWATIRKAGKVVFDERQWPMLSEYVGPHYGNNVALPGAGLYRLTLLISPPVAARHLEYKNVWLKPHRVSYTFRWRPTS
jgi:Fe2+ transport protein